MNTKRLSVGTLRQRDGAPIDHLPEEVRARIERGESGDESARHALATEAARARLREGTIRVREEGDDEKGEKKKRRELVIATENPVEVMDWETWDTIPEILLMRGMRPLRSDYLPLQDSHKRSSASDTIGHVERIRVEGTQLVGEAEFAGTERGREAETLVDEGHLRAVSIGFEVHRYQRIAEDEQWEDNGRTFRGPALVAVDWSPREASIVAVPADSDSEFRHLPEGEMLSLVGARMLRAGATRTGADAGRNTQTGIDAKEVKRAMKKYRLKSGDYVTLGELLELRMQGPVEMFDGTVQPQIDEPKVEADPKPEPARTGDDPETIAERARATERERVAKVRGILQEVSDEIVERAITQGWSIGRAQAVADACRANKPQEVRVTRDQRDTFRAAAVDGIRLRAGQKIENPHEAAREFANMSLRDVLRESLEVAGSYRRGMSTDEMLLEAFGNRGARPKFFQHGQRSGSGAFSHTTSDLPLLLADVMGKALQSAYEEANTTYQAWTRPVNLPDFKSRKVVRLSESPDLAIVGENGEIPEGGLTEQQETYALDTFARILSINRQTIINDDLDALVRVPAMMGAAARRVPNRLTYRILKANADMSDGVALFNAAHGNLGGSTALSTQGLSELRKLMRKQVGMQAANDAGEQTVLNIEPTFLLVGPTLEGLAMELITSSAKPEATNSGVTNVHRNALTPVIDAELEQGAGAWTYEYAVAASTNQIDTVEVGFLNGVDAPMVTEEEGFDVLGIRLRVVLDCGAKAIDWRGLAKSAGADPWAE